MKNLWKYFMTMAVAVVALSACQKEFEQKTTSKEGTLKISVKANVDDTKSYIDGTAIKWGTGEYMKIGVYDGTATTFGNSTDESADLWNGDAEALFNFSITPANTADEYTYYGLYPASAAVASSNTNPASYKVSLPAAQNATATSYDPKAYILVAKPEGGKTITSTDWEASFRRATALNQITLKNLPEAIKRVTITAPENGTVMWEVNGDGECVTSIDPMVGKEYQEGDRFCYLQNQFGQVIEVPAALGGKLVEVCAKQGSKVRKGDTIAFIRRK